MLIMINTILKVVGTRIELRLGAIIQSMRRWPVGVHLLLAVNVPLAALLAVLMVYEYGNEMDAAILAKEGGLADESVAVQQAVAHLAQEHSRTSLEPIQEFINHVCAKMQESRSPGHTIVVSHNNQTFHSSDHGHLVVDADEALLGAFRSGRSRFRWHNELIVLGGHDEDGTAVVIAELATNIRRNARLGVLWKLGAVAILALIAAAIVDAVLWRLIRTPLRRLSATVDAVARGEFEMMREFPVGRELQALTRSFNSMSAALAMNEHHRRKELERAREIQQHLLPIGVLVPGLNVCCDFQPAEEVAGDYYDLFPLSNGAWLMVVADVAGHGIPAAMAATLLKALLLCEAEHSHAPEVILGHVNQRIVALLPTGMFITVLLAVWYPDTRRFVYVNAGHPPGLIWNLQNEFRELSATALPLGIQSDIVYQPSELELEEDERVVWFTDGLVEAFSPAGELFGMNRLQQVIRQQRGGTVQGLRDAVLEAVRLFAGDAILKDDLTLLVAGTDEVRSHRPVGEVNNPLLARSRFLRESNFS